jgi:signal transduction histidine kinase
MKRKQAILCVDDESIVLTSLRDQLMRGFPSEVRIELAESGEEALEVVDELNKEGYELPLIIADQIMPGMKGDELLTAMHKKYPKTLKIFLTGQADACAVGNAVNDANLYRYIQKPWNEEDLKLTVERALDSYNKDKKLAVQNRRLKKLYAKAQKEIDERIKVEKLLEKTNRNLENLVYERTRELSLTLDNLKKTQDQLIVQEKMASLGMLSAGVAHEIKNPLNLINSFAGLNLELGRELEELLNSYEKTQPSQPIDNIRETIRDLLSNSKNILEEGVRADKIIRSMMHHARDGKNDMAVFSVNELVREALTLAYHGLKTSDNPFDFQIKTNLDESAPEMQVMGQALSRVLVNLINNAYYAMKEKKAQMGDGYTPKLTVSTRDTAKFFEIRIKDNGPGMEKDVLKKIFDPFFTTKPPGKGTGLGLSISHDIICRGHQGKLEVDSKKGGFTEFVISLPKK